MKNINYILLILLFTFVTSCISTKGFIKNIDDNAATPILKDDNSFVIKNKSSNPNYGFNKDYPINIFYANTLNDTINQMRFLNALAGPKGEELIYSKEESCCPFPTNRSNVGAGFLDVYKITWSKNTKPILLYFNIYEKGILEIPVGLTSKKRD